MEFDPSSTVTISVVIPNNNTNSASPNTDLTFQLASVLECGPPVYNPNQTECTEVITEQPPQYNDLFPPAPEGRVSIEEDSGNGDSTEDIAIVEQALSAAHFNEATGFTLKYGGPVCCPSLSIIPTLNHSPVTLGAVDWKIRGSSSDKCHCCCCFPPISIGWEREWQTMPLKQNEQEILNFVYSPMICFCGGRKESLVDIYIPQRNQRIAYLRQGGNFSDGAILTDCVSKSVFKMKKLDVRGSSVPFAMKVLTQEGTPIAIAQPTKGLRRGGWTTWTNFELKFNANLPSNLLSASSKSVVMVAFAMWAINYREENSRLTFVCLLVGITFLILFLVMATLGDSNSSY